LISAVSGDRILVWSDPDGSSDQRTHHSVRSSIHLPFSHLLHWLVLKIPRMIQLKGWKVKRQGCKSHKSPATNMCHNQFVGGHSIFKTGINVMPMI